MSVNASRPALPSRSSLQQVIQRRRLLMSMAISGANRRSRQASYRVGPSRPPGTPSRVAITPVKSPSMAPNRRGSAGMRLSLHSIDVGSNTYVAEFDTTNLATAAAFQAVDTGSIPVTRSIRLPRSSAARGTGAARAVQRTAGSRERRSPPASARSPRCCRSRAIAGHTAAPRPPSRLLQRAGGETPAPVLARMPVSQFQPPPSASCTTMASLAQTSPCRTTRLNVPSRPSTCCRNSSTGGASRSTAGTSASRSSARWQRPSPSSATSIVRPTCSKLDRPSLRCRVEALQVESRLEDVVVHDEATPLGPGTLRGVVVAHVGGDHGRVEEGRPLLDRRGQRPPVPAAALLTIDDHPHEDGVPRHLRVAGEPRGDDPTPGFAPRGAGSAARAGRPAWSSTRRDGQRHATSMPST